MRGTRRYQSLGAALILALVWASPAQAQKKSQPERRGKQIKQNKGKDDCKSFFWSWPTKKRAYVGIVAIRLTEELRSHFGAPTGVGMLVARVDSGSPAVRAGVKVGDVLVAVNDQQVHSSWDVLDQVRNRKKGDRIRLRLVRRGKPLTVQATLDVRETPQVEVGSFLKRGGILPRGVHASPDVDVRVGDRCFDQTMKRLRRQIQQQMRSLGRTKHIRRFLEREKALERRLREMEKKLRRLERRTK